MESSTKNDETVDAPPSPAATDFARSIVALFKSYGSGLVAGLAAIEPERLASAAVAYLRGELPTMPAARIGALRRACADVLSMIDALEAAGAAPPSARLIVNIELPRSMLARPTADVLEFVVRQMEPRLTALAIASHVCAADRAGCGCAHEVIAAGRCLVFAPDGSERVP